MWSWGSMAEISVDSNMDESLREENDIKQTIENVKLAKKSQQN